MKIPEHNFSTDSRRDDDDDVYDFRINQAPEFTIFKFNSDNMRFDEDTLSGLSVYEDYNYRGDVYSVLISHGWTVTKETATKLHLSKGDATGFLYSEKTFKVEKDTDGFQANFEYRPFHVFAILECDGDQAHAKIRLKANDFGKYSHVKAPKIDTSNVSYLDKDGKVNPMALCEYLSRNNIVRVSRPGNDTLSVYHIDKKILREFNYKSETLAFLSERITGQNKADIVNKIYENRNAVQDVFKLMPGVAFDFHRDTKDSVFIPFKNAVLKVSAGNDPELINYDDPQIKYFAEAETQKHDFFIPDIDTRTEGNFELFIQYAVVGRKAECSELTEAERRDLRAFHSMIGYLVSNYKNAAKTPAIVLSDDGADDEARRGRRGKTILTKAIGMLKKSVIRGGLEFDPGYRHNFATLTELHKLFLIDDVPAGFNYNALYTQIAGDILSEKKGTHAVEIPFRDAPKFVITTNWAVRYDSRADSTNDRFKEYKFSYFWNVNNKPDVYFNQLFFEDWDDAEWQKFFEFMMMCVWEFLTNGLQEIKYNKEADNFRAYFSNDVLLQEFERIMPAMRLKIDSQGYFTTTDFLEAHSENFRNKPLFNHINVKSYILSYSESKGLNLSQDTKRRWTSLISGDEVKDNLPF